MVHITTQKLSDYDIKRHVLQTNQLQNMPFLRILAIFDFHSSLRKHFKVPWCDLPLIAEHQVHRHCYPLSELSFLNCGEIEQFKALLSYGYSPPLSQYLSAQKFGSIRVND